MVAALARLIASAPRARLASQTDQLCCTAPRLRYNPAGHRICDTQSLADNAWHFAQFETDIVGAEISAGIKEIPGSVVLAILQRDKNYILI